MIASSETRRMGLALSGGGTCGFAHLGVLQALEDNGIRPHCMAGTSIGSLAAALYAFGLPLPEIRSLAERITPLSVSMLSLSRYALFSDEALGRLIQSKIGHARIEDSPIPLAIIAVDIGTGEEIVMRTGEVAPAVMASNAVPGVYRPIFIDGRMLVDGGLAENVPISPLRPMGADVVVAVNLAAGRQYKTPENIMEVMFNALDIAIDRDTKIQVQAADVLIEPTIAQFSRTDVSRIDELIAEGYRAAAEKAQSITQLLGRHRS